VRVFYFARGRARRGCVCFARAQIVLAETETLDFDRFESWGMKYYVSVALLTGMGVLHKQVAGDVELGFESGYVFC
jgi:hypothetical protein